MSLLILQTATSFITHCSATDTIADTPMQQETQKHAEAVQRTAASMPVECKTKEQPCQCSDTQCTEEVSS